MSLVDSLVSIFRPNGPSLSRPAPPCRRARGAGGYSAEIEAAIDGATLHVRHFANVVDEDGSSTDGVIDRVVVISPSLRGSFVFDTETARERIERAFPEAGEATVQRAVRHLASRVRVRLAPEVAARRNSWVNDWTKDRPL